MAHLANVTKIMTLTTVRRARTLAHGGQILVPVGHQVEPTHVVARGPAEGAFQVLWATKLLNIAPQELYKYLLASEGVEVEKGTPLLRRPTAFGRSKVYRCPADATLIRVRDGCLVLQRTDKVADLRAMLSGRVVSVIPDRGVVIEAVGSLVQAVWDSGKSGCGRLQPAPGSAQNALNFEHIGPEATGAVYVAGFVDRPEVLESLEERGARGLVAGSMPASLCQQIDEFSFPVLLTEGVGRRPMAEPIFELLQRSQGRDVSLLAASRHPRWQKAEIIISLPTSGPLQQVESDDASLQTGSLVRVFGLNGQTMVGRVTRVFSQPRRTALGSMTVGVDVALDDGKVLFTPSANLDIIG